MPSAKKSSVSAIFTSLVIIIVFVICFERSLSGLLVPNAESNSSPLDEIALLVLFLISVSFLLFRRVMSNNILVCVMALGLFCFTVSVLFGLNGNVTEVFLQTFLHLQFFIIFFCLYLLYLGGFFNPQKIFPILVVVAAIGAVIQMLLPELFGSIFGYTKYSDNALSFRALRLEGFQKNPNALGGLISIYIATLMFCSTGEKLSDPKKLFFIGLLFVLLVSTGSRSAFIYVLVAYVCLPNKLLKKIGVTLFGFAVLFVSGDLQFIIEKSAFNLSLIFDNSYEVEYVRWTLLKTGFALAVENFPIGAGAGTYGSAFSRDSVVYAEQGISTINAISSARNIHDSNIGTLLGEFGILGFALFISLFIYCIRFGFIHFEGRRRHLNVSKQKNMRFLVMLFCVMVISIFLRPFFSSSYYSIVFTISYLYYLDFWYGNARMRNSR